MARRKKAGPRTPSGQLSRAKADAHFAEETVMGPLDWPCVYILSTGSAVKVGFSKVLSTRVKDLETASDVPIKIFHAFRVQGSGAYKAEQMFHKLAKGTQYHLRGEWYDLPPTTAVNVLRKIMDRLALTYMDHELHGFGRNEER